MSIAYLNLIGLLVAHYVGDFIFQPRFIGDNKSKKPEIMALHCLLYALPFWLLFGPEVALATGALHFPVDMLSSQITRMLYKEKQYYGFFSIIGLDQLMHYVVLIYTLHFML
jgi:hypothetical protein